MKTETRRQHVRSVVVALVAAAVLAPAASSEALDYTVKPGDTLSKLAERFYDDSAAWRRIAEANNFDVDASGFRPGQRIFIPEDGDPAHPAARVAKVSGGAWIVEAGRTERQRVQVGSPLLWQGTLHTGPAARAELALQDGSRLIVGPGAEVSMLGTRGDAGVVRVRLLAGSVELIGEPDAQVEVAAARRLVTLRGRQGRVTCAHKTIELRTIDGEAWIGGLRVEPGRLVRLDARGQQAEGGALPGPVEFTGDARPRGVLVGLGAQGEVELQWTGVAGATAYDLEVGEPGETPRRWRLAAEQTRQSVPLARSSWQQARIRGVNADGEAGPWRSLDFFGVRGLTAVDVGGGGSGFTGAAVVRLEQGGPGTLLYTAVNGGRWSLVGGEGAELQATGAGVHQLRVRVVQFDPDDDMVPLEVFEGSRQVRVQPLAHVDVDFSPRELDPLAPVTDVQVIVRLSDSSGAPVGGDLPVVQAGRRWCEAQPVAEEPGVYRCVLRPRAAPGLEQLELSVTGRGGSFTWSDNLTVRVPDPGVLQARR